MTKERTNWLTGKKLDLAVAMCEYRGEPTAPYAEYSKDSSKMDRIIRREGIVIDRDGDAYIAMMIDEDTGDESNRQTGKTRLEAAARCYVSCEYGATIKLPEEKVAA